MTEGHAPIERIKSLHDAAVALGLSASHVRRLVRQGKFAAFRVGGIWLTTDEAVATYRRQRLPRGRPRKTR
jgi:excisionase family DNA binding protein